MRKVYLWKIALLTLVLGTLMPLPATMADDTLPNDDAGSGGDASDSPEDALLLEPGTYSGSLFFFTDREDHYKFAVPAGQGYSLSIDAGNAKGQFIGDSRVAASTFADVYGRTNDAREVGVRIYTQALQPEDYTFTFAMAPDPQDDAGSGLDAGRTEADAMHLSHDVDQIAGRLGRYDDIDHYTFDVVGKQRVSLRAEADPHAWFGLLVWNEPTTEVDKKTGAGPLFINKTWENETVHLVFGFERPFGTPGGDSSPGYIIDVGRDILAAGDPDAVWLPDLVITDVVEHSEPFEAWVSTGITNVSVQEDTALTRKWFTVNITNVGNTKAMYADLLVTVEGGVERATHLNRTTLVEDDRWLPAGETITREYVWPHLRDAGRYRFTFTATAWEEEHDLANNVAVRESWTKVDQDLPPLT